MSRLLAFLLLAFSSLCHGAPFADGFDHGSCAVTQRHNLGITIGPPAGGSDLKLTMAVEALPVRKGEALQGALIGQGGTAPYVYSIAGGSLPTGVTLNGSTGILSGTPTTVGRYTFLAQVQDAALGVYKCTLAIQVIPPLDVVAGTPPPAENGVAYAYQFSVSGATGSVTWALTSGAMPSGLSIDAAGLMSGTPADFGPFNFVVTATDGGSGDTLDVHCSIYNYLALGSASISTARNYVVGLYSDQIIPSGFVATGGVPTVKFNFTDLPSWVTGVSILNADGVSGARYPILSGTPDTAGAQSISYTITDALGITAAHTFTFNVLTSSTNTSLGTSDLLLPTQKAVKTYVDNQVAGVTFPVTSVFGRTGTVTAQSGDYTATQVGLGNVTNDTQTKAAIVPNTAPSPGQMLVGNAGGTAYAPVSMSGDATLADTGALTIANAAVTNAKLANMAAHTMKVNKTGSSAAPTDESLSAFLDAEIGSTRGMLLRRGSAAWQALALGTTGQAVVSDGTDAKWGSVGGGSGGGLSFVGSATVTGSAATTLSISGLDLDTDGRYFVITTLQNATGSSNTVSLYYNSDTTAGNYDIQSITGNGATVTSSRANTAQISGMSASANSTATNYIWISNDLRSRPTIDSFRSIDDTTSLILQLITHKWRTAATNVTGITISGSVASGLAIGSKIEVWKTPNS